MHGVRYSLPNSFVHKLYITDELRTEDIRSNWLWKVLTIRINWHPNREGNTKWHTQRTECWMRRTNFTIKPDRYVIFIIWMENEVEVQHFSPEIYLRFESISYKNDITIAMVLYYISSFETCGFNLFKWFWKKLVGNTIKLRLVANGGAV